MSGLTDSGCITIENCKGSLLGIAYVHELAWFVEKGTRMINSYAKEMITIP